jgi:cytidylate kinase
MAQEARMTIRLDAATRRKVERLAAREGISLNEAVARLVQSASDEPSLKPRGRYRLKPRRKSFGFDIAQAKRLLGEMIDAEALARLERRS